MDLRAFTGEIQCFQEIQEIQRLREDLLEEIDTGN
jgi:hypothetical protein